LRAPRAAALRDTLLVALVLGLAASISLSEAALIALGLWLAWSGRARAWGGWPLAGPLVAFAAWSVVAALASAAPAESLRATRTLLPLAALWVVFGALDGGAAARRLASIFLVVLTAVALLSIVQVATCTPERYDVTPRGLSPVARSFFGKCRRAHGFFSIYMTLAGVLTVTLAAALPRVVTAGARGLAAGAAWLASAAALALTLVRGAWIGLAAGVLVALAGLRRRALAAAAVAAVAAAVLAVPSVRERAATLGPGDATAGERLAMLHAGLQLVREHPVAGIGPGQVKRVYPVVAPPEALRRSTSHLHDTPLQIAVERGLVGLALWLWIFVAFFRRAGRVLRRLPAEAVADRALVLGSLAGIAAFLVAGLFEYNFGDTEVLLVALSVMALPFVVERDRVERAA
jgi:O-antigen ligase